MIIVAFGSNLPGPWGTPLQTIMRAGDEMARYNIRIRKISRMYETAPYGVRNQPAFFNAVAIVESSLPPEAMMRALHLIERKAGRVRRKRWGPRVLDLDLLDYNGLVRKAARTSIKPLALPHPGIAQRPFVLEPIAEIAPRWRHPVTRCGVKVMLRKLSRLKRG